MLLGLTGCSTPFEQLSFPDAVAHPSGLEPSRPAETGANGLRLSDKGALVIPHVFAGSGDFTNQVSQTEEPRATAWASQTALVPSQTTADGITINLANATIAELSKTVLGDILGVNYSVSDKLKGSITLRTAHPVSASGMLEIFQAALRNEGAVLVVLRDLYEVVPATDAAAAGAPLRRDGGVAGSAGVGTEIVPLRYVSATDMERVLHSAAPQAGVLRVDTARNLLMLTGTDAEIAALQDIIDTFDVDWMRGMSFGLFPTESADPEAIAKELDSIFANDTDSPSKGMARFIGNRRLKSVLVVSSRSEYIRKAERWIARIDKVSQATQKQVYVYHVQHRPVADLAKLLQKVYGGEGSTGGASALGGLASALDQSHPATAIATGASGAASSGAAGGSAAGAAGSAPAPASAAVATADMGSVASASSGGSGGAPEDDRSAGISVVGDEPNNSLVITATTKEYRRVLRILETLDTQPNEILLEATIAEVSLNDQINFGVRWFFQNNSGSNSLSFTDATGKIPGPLAGLSYLINGANIKFLLNALKNVTHVDVLSQPSLMMLENKKATLQVGDEVPILTQTQQSAAITGTPTVSNAVSYRNTGILLEITPRVGKDGRVLLEIEQEVSDTKSNTTSGIDSPSFSQRRIKTTVVVKDGETIVLAGMIQDKSTRSHDEIPILGQIPVIGNAFKNKTDSIVRTELLIAITPQVVKDSRQIDAIADEFRDSLNFSTRPQRKTGPDRTEDFSRLIR